MTTHYYVVPSDRWFTDTAKAAGVYGSKKLADKYAAGLKDDTGTDYSVYEVKLVTGSCPMSWERTMHVVGDRRIITGKHYLGGYSAHDDGMGEDTSPYGYGETPEAAIAKLLETLNEQNLAA